MSNDMTMTIAGNVVDDPTMRRIPGGTVVTNFRVASTSRRYDREQQGFVDNTTVFVTVNAWRSLGENVHASLRKGQPVVVSGRFVQRNYVVNEQPRSSYALEATSIGHDLSRGVSTFEKTSRPGTPTVALDEERQPADESAHFFPYDDESVGAHDGHLNGDHEPSTEPMVAGMGGYQPDPSARGLAFAS